ncbi:TPA: hypothetical protein L4U47_004345 [Pseudomonas aeruginosa]|nr:hypothetical protein [Pseudomonas aeruginosa]
MTNANECTCPSGDGSLRHPCPAHPAVEQAGGDERDLQGAQGERECGHAACKSLGEHHPFCKFVSDQDRAALAQPSPDAPYADDIAADLERSDWTPEDALRWYAAGKHFDTVNGRTRIIDTGTVASNALKHLSLPYLEMKGDAELTELREAHAQPSPAQAEGFTHFPELMESVQQMDAMLKANSAQPEQPEVVGYLLAKGNGTLSILRAGSSDEPVMTVAQHERIVGELRAENAKLSEALDECDGDRWKLRSERDAALARVAEHEAKLAEMERQEPSGWLAHYFGGKRNGRIYGGPCNTKEEIDRYIQQVERSDDSITLQGKPFYAAPVAQPEETPGEILAAKLIETWVTKHGKPAPWSTAIEITAVATNMPNDERDRLLALDDDVDAQAQHSVPEGWMLVPVEQLLNMMSDKDHDTRIMAERQLLAVLAAAPSKEGL